MLRQNLFERFSSVSSIPSESPIVPVVLPRPQPVGIRHSTPEKGMQSPMYFNVFGTAKLKAATFFQLFHGAHQIFKWNYRNLHLHHRQNIQWRAYLSERQVRRMEQIRSASGHRSPLLLVAGKLGGYCRGGRVMHRYRQQRLGWNLLRQHQ